MATIMAHHNLVSPSAWVAEGVQRPQIAGREPLLRAGSLTRLRSQITHHARSASCGLRDANPGDSELGPDRRQVGPGRSPLVALRQPRVEAFPRVVADFAPWGRHASAGQKGVP